MVELSQLSKLSPDSKHLFQKEIHFSSWLTAVCLCVCALGAGVFLWNMSFSEDFHPSMSVSRDLERVASRLLNFESRLPQLSIFEQAIFRVWGTDGDTQEQVHFWYTELSEERRQPIDALYLGILTGETESSTELMGAMKMLNSAISPYPVFRRLLDVGYLGGDQGKKIDYDRLQARLAEEVPANWFYYHLAQRLAYQSGDKVLREHLEQQLQQLTESELWKWRMLIIIELVLAGLGFICLVYLVVGWFRENAVHAIKFVSERASPWTFREGLAVLVRGGALSIFFIACMSVLPSGVNVLENYGSLFLYLPIVMLVIVLLCWPKDQSFLKVIGCTNFLHHFRSSYPILFAVIALGLMGDWLIMLGADMLDCSVHWTEWFLPQLIWGGQIELLTTIVEVVVLAPIFEEIIFRGMVFSTMRAKFGFTVSMIGSALVFALMHGYGPIAFLSVFWSGLLWAWIYERTGSVIPGICAHATNNGLVVSLLVAIFR